MSVHVSSRLIFSLSAVGNFFRVLPVVSCIFRPLSLVGEPHSHPLTGRHSCDGSSFSEGVNGGTQLSVNCEVFG